MLLIWICCAKWFSGALIPAKHFAKQIQKNFGIILTQSFARTTYEGADKTPDNQMYSANGFVQLECVCFHSGLRADRSYRSYIKVNEKNKKKCIKYIIVKISY